MIYSLQGAVLNGYRAILRFADRESAMRSLREQNATLRNALEVATQSLEAGALATRALGMDAMLATTELGRLRLEKALLKRRAEDLFVALRELVALKRIKRLIEAGGASQEETSRYEALKEPRWAAAEEAIERFVK